jgi:hypothetical protein
MSVIFYRYIACSIIFQSLVTASCISSEYLRVNFDNSNCIKTLRGDIGAGQFSAGIKGQAYTGGGKNEKITIPLSKPFPVNQGTLSLFFRINKSLEGSHAVLFDVLGSPNWWDRFYVVLAGKDDKTIITVTACETKSKRYAGRAIGYKTNLALKKWYNLTFTWNNINSKKANASLKLYLDGVLVSQKDNFELSMKDIARKMLIGGVNPPIKAGPSACVSIDEFVIYNKALAPDKITQLANCIKKKLKIPEKALATVSKLTGKAPVIDGKFSAGEWSGTQNIGFFRNHLDKGFLVKQQPVVNLARSNSKLYIGWQIECGGRPKGMKHPRDKGRLWVEDSLEILLSPDGKKIVHFIGNAYSSIYDEISQDGGKNWDKEWNADCKYKASFANGVWTGELEVDLKKIDFPIPVNGSKWGFNVCHNGQTPKLVQSMWNYYRGSYKELAGMGEICFDDNAIIIEKIKIPEAIAGNNKIYFTLRNPFKAKNQLLFDFVSRRKKRDYIASMLLPDARRANGDINLEYSIPKSGAVECLLSVKNPQNGQALLSYPTFMQVLPPLRIDLIKSFSKGFVIAEINAVKLKNVNSGTITIADKSGKKVYTTSISNKALHNIKIPTDKLNAGNYQMAVVMCSKNGQEIAKRLIPLRVHQKPLYVSKTAGSVNYMKPWGDLELQGQTVLAWNRQYTYKDTIFPLIMKSAKKDLLAGTPYFMYTYLGEKRYIKHAEFSIVKKTGAEIVAEVKAEDKYIVVSGNITFEYDGAIIYSLNIKSKQKIKLQNLKLQVPLNSESAKYILEGSETDFSDAKNKIGSTPGWKRDMFFKTMFGIGCAERALLWFCESDEGWKPYDRKDTISVERTQNNVLLTFNIIENSYLRKPLKMSCGFICTPLRPLKYNFNDLKICHYWPGGPFYSLDNFSYEQFNLEKAAEFGTKIVVLHEWWVKFYGGFEPANPDSLKKFVKKAHRLGIRVLLYKAALASQNSPQMAYYGDSWLIYPIIGFMKYKGISRPNTSGIARCAAAPDFIDWFVGSSRELIRQYGIDGFFYDFDVAPCLNGDHNCGYAAVGSNRRKGKKTKTIDMDYISDSVDLNRRTTTPVLKHRLLYKRMYNMVKEEKGEQGIINAHIGDPGYTYYCPFIDSAYHSEHAACYNKPGFLPSPETYRLFYSKEFLGIPGDMISYKEKRYQEDLAISLLHREWYRPKSFSYTAYFRKQDYLPVSKIWKVFEKFNIDKAAWHPYWLNQSKLEFGPVKKIYVSFWEKPDEMLLVISNLSKETQNAKILLKGNLKNYKQAIDAIDGGKINLANGVISLKLSSHNYKLIKVKK